MEESGELMETVESSKTVPTQTAIQTEPELEGKCDECADNQQLKVEIRTLSTLLTADQETQPDSAPAGPSPDRFSQHESEVIKTAYNVGSSTATGKLASVARLASWVKGAICNIFKITNTFLNYLLL